MPRRAESGFCVFRYTGRVRWTGPLSVAQLALAAVPVSSTSALAQSPPAERTIEGRARIVDGDTLEIGVHRIRLHGVDAPEPDQHCQREGRPWRCGAEATYAMAALIETHWLTCDLGDRNGAGDLIAVCRMGGPKGRNVNQEIVRRGWALALRSAGDDYIAAELEAKAAKVGLWSGTFVAPWEWRRTRESGKTGN